MSERDRESNDGAEAARNAEWQLPASLASKHAVTTAADSLVPKHDITTHRFFESETLGPLAISRNDREARAEWTIRTSQPPHPDSDRWAWSDEVYVAGAHELPTLTSNVQNAYTLSRGSADDDISLRKTEWANKSARDEPLEVSEGEAKALLRGLTGLTEVPGLPKNYKR